MCLNNHRYRITVSDSFCLFAALLILTVPLQWLLAAAAAAAIHELGHICAVRLCGGLVSSIVVQPGSACIHTSAMQRSQNAAALAAGPLASLSLVLLFPLLPRTALCGLVQGAFNLLPMMPLDGGRLLRALPVSDGICNAAEALCLAILVCSSGAVCFFLKSPLPAAALLFLFLSHRRKIPCKPTQFGVQ